MSSVWVNEYINIKENYVGEFTDYITELSENNGISNRFTVLMLGVLCKQDSRVYVDIWLENLGMDILTRRNQADALFIYAYESLKEIPVEKRQELFVDYLIEYFEWKKKNGFFIEDHDSIKKPSKRNYLFSDITTFGELHDRLKRNSHETITGTMNTVQTDKDAMIKLEEIIADNKGLSEFLDYLKNDVSIRDYNRKATFYIQKMLYGMIKYPLDLLCEHNLPEDDERKCDYIEAKKFILSNEYGSKLAFDRYIKYNRLFLKNVKSDFREWLIKNKDITVAECIDYLRDKPIFYNRLFTSFYYFLIGKKYGAVEDIMTKEGKERGYEEVDLPEGVYVNIFGDCIQCDKRIMTFLINAVSGNVYVKRSFLILFGTYVGYDLERLNNVLKESGFGELSRETKLDNSVIQILEYEIPRFMRDTVNTVNFLNRVEPEEDERSVYYPEMLQVGEIERNDYEERIQEITESLDFKNYISDEGDSCLMDIFNTNLTKKMIDDFTGTEVKKLGK